MMVSGGVSGQCWTRYPNGVRRGVLALLGGVKHLVSTQNIVIALPCLFFWGGASK